MRIILTVERRQVFFGGAILELISFISKWIYALTLVISSPQPHCCFIPMVKKAPAKTFCNRPKSSARNKEKKLFLRPAGISYTSCNRYLYVNS